jgi:hypothetical protein
MYIRENKFGTLVIDLEIVKIDVLSLVKKICKQNLLGFRMEEKDDQEYLFFLKYQNKFDSNFLDDTRALASKMERSIEKLLKVERTVVVIELVP